MAFEIWQEEYWRERFGILLRSFEYLGREEILHTS